MLVIRFHQYWSYTKIILIYPIFYKESKILGSIKQIYKTFLLKPESVPLFELGNINSSKNIADNSLKENLTIILISISLITINAENL